MAKMTKAQIIEKLSGMGEMHLDMMSWKKSDLENYYNRTMEARSMSLEELRAKLISEGKM